MGFHFCLQLYDSCGNALFEESVFSDHVNKLFCTLLPFKNLETGFPILQILHGSSSNSLLPSAIHLWCAVLTIPHSLIFARFCTRFSQCPKFFFHEATWKSRITMRVNYREFFPLNLLLSKIIACRFKRYLHTVYVSYPLLPQRHAGEVTMKMCSLEVRKVSLTTN